MQSVRRLALLVDAENVPPAFATALVNDAAGHGELAIRRAYGDFSGDALRGWAEACPRLAIRAHQVFPGARGKNAADLALAIDAIDLLHTGGVAGFCLASSDGDFSHLALRLREHGAAVIGYGERKAPESFRQACGRFVELVPPAPALVAVAPGVAKPVAAKPNVNAARDLLRRAHGQCAKAVDGWVHGSQLRNEVARIEAGFTTAAYGHGTFRKFVTWAGGFDIESKDGAMLVKRSAQA